MLEIKIQDTDTAGVIIVGPTDGYLLLYMESNKIKMKGQMDFSALAPLVAKVIMEKMVTPK